MRIEIDNKTFERMLEYDQIKKRIRLLGIQINVDFENRIPVFIGVLNGSFVFLGDLIKEVNIASEVSFVNGLSYNGDKSNGEIKKEIGFQLNLKDRVVIIVEDITDSGETLEYVLGMIKKEEPASVNVCTLPLKPKSLKRKFEEISYVGFE